MVEGENKKEKQMQEPSPCQSQKASLTRLMQSCQFTFPCGIKIGDGEQPWADGIISVSHSRDKSNLTLCVWQLEKGSSDCVLVKRFSLYVLHATALAGFINAIPRIAVSHFQIRENEGPDEHPYVS
jgi:hypothetical protein